MDIGELHAIFEPIRQLVGGHQRASDLAGGADLVEGPADGVAALLLDLATSDRRPLTDQASGVDRSTTPKWAQSARTAIAVRLRLRLYAP
jgi:hypothetical protein